MQVAKYGKIHWRPVYSACKRLFAALPLAALVAQNTLVLHGGLFRAPLQRNAGKNKRKRTQPLFNGESSCQRLCGWLLRWPAPCQLRYPALMPAWAVALQERIPR